MARSIVSFLAGVVFAVGLAIGGMTNPAKVIAFLDVTGRWDPSLAFVMGGAMSVYAVSWWLLRGDSPLLATSYAVTTKTAIDGRLLGGAAMFGAGWGLAGFCPGPALTSLVTGTTPVIAFVGAMLVGMVVENLALQPNEQPAGA